MPAPPSPPQERRPHPCLAAQAEAPLDFARDALASTIKPFDKTARHIAGPPRPVDDVAVCSYRVPTFVVFLKSFGSPPGGDEGIRTPDLCFAKAALSQLSYIPAQLSALSPQPSARRPLSNSGWLIADR